MDADTSRAHKLSVEHWRRMVENKMLEGEKPNGRHCALCGLFNDVGNGCDGCPIKEVTGRVFCYGTPYQDAVAAWCVTHRWSKDFAAKARVMLQFLEDLPAKLAEKRAGK